MNEAEVEKIDPDGRVSIPVSFLPMFRTTIALQGGVANKLLFKTWGGLGDQICAEPTLRYALKHFKDVDVSLASEWPQLFSHLKFANVFDLKKDKVNPEDYFVFETITPPNDTNLVWQFFSHMLTNCVDFPSLCALRCQLPVESREILLSPKLERENLKNYTGPGHVVVHAGKHWPSKTFPKDWWDRVLRSLVARNIIPILIGADTDDNRGTVDVDASFCVDLRNKLSIMDSIWLLQNCEVVLTNDSSPLHMAASRDPENPRSGQAHIGYIATCKHPDFITHFRREPGGKIIWQWREENLGLGGIWDLVDHCPNKAEQVTADKVNETTLRSWLPDPILVADWAYQKIHGNKIRGSVDQRAFSKSTN